MGENMDQPMTEENLSPPAAQVKKTKRTPKVLRLPEAEMKTAKKTPKRSAVLNTADIWAVQCRECHKWRVIPTQEEYEEIRRNSMEDPFTCQRKENASCDDLADLEFGTKRLWVIDKPNLPKTPAGFKRRLTMRRNLSRMDCYYETPDGKKLRAPTEVATFLIEHPEFKDVSQADFSFRAPKIARDTIPLSMGGKKGSIVRVADNSNAG